MSLESSKVAATTEMCYTAAVWMIAWSPVLAAICAGVLYLRKTAVGDQLECLQAELAAKKKLLDNLTDPDNRTARRARARRWVALARFLRETDLGSVPDWMLAD